MNTTQHANQRRDGHNVESRGTWRRKGHEVIMGIRITEQRLKRDNDLPADFRFYAWEFLTNGNIEVGTKLDGGLCPLKTRGKHKGLPCWPKLTGRQSFVVTNEQAAVYESDYEVETGNCHVCEGSGKVMKSWSREHGRVDQDCRRCGATGKAPT